MKNNIRYSNSNNTSVIIFLIVKNSQRCYFAWENLRGGFCCIFISFLIFILLLLYLLFILDVHFVVICRFSSFTFLPFNVVSRPSMDYRRGFYTPFYTFSPAHRRAICDTFIFNFSNIFLPSATVLSERFLPTGVFYLTLLYQHF